MDLIKSYGKFLYRYGSSNKGNVLVSSFSLILGITSTLFIVLYLQHQFGYDSWHTNGDRIYRVVMDVSADGSTTSYATTGKPLGPLLKENFDEVDGYVSFRTLGSVTLKKEGEVFKEDHVYAGNMEVFNIFDFPILEGNKEEVLNEPFKVVLNESLAQKYFGNQSAVGKELEINGQLYMVSGIMENLPANAHLSINALISNEDPSVSFSLQDWFDLENYTYIRLAENNKNKSLSGNLKLLVENYLSPVTEDGQMKISFQLQPLEDVHFSSGLTMDRPNGNKSYGYIFMAVALLILLIACFNYINLTMALSLNRGREIGIRKAIGGTRKDLYRQLIFESFSMAIISFLVSVALVVLLFPVFKELAGLEGVFLPDVLNRKFLVFSVGIIVFVGILGGIYPLLYLAALAPVEALQNKSAVKNNVGLQKTLLIIQFSASLVMVICTLILRDQINFLHSRELGFSKEEVLLIDLPEDVSNYNDILRVKNLMLANAFIENASLCGYGSVPGTENGKDIVEFSSNGKRSEKVLNTFSWDENYLDLLNIEIAIGRNFSAKFPSDKEKAILVNEQFVKEFNWENPLSEKIMFQGVERQVIGVVKDFHYTSLHNLIEPVVITHHDESLQKLLVKVRKKDLSAVETIWKQHIPGSPFVFTYLDDFWNSQYTGDKRMIFLFTLFSALAVLLACMGLLGLSLFMVKQRVKEIGIRRVLGAGYKDIFMAISQGFKRVVFISVIVAIPVSLYLARAMQNEFPYKAGISIGIYSFTILCAILLVVLTLGYNVRKGMLSNPVENLKTDL